MTCNIGVFLEAAFHTLELGLRLAIIRFLLQGLYLIMIINYN
jgi:hypothetical protein